MNAKRVKRIRRDMLGYFRRLAITYDRPMLPMIAYSDDVVKTVHIVTGFKMNADGTSVPQIRVEQRTRRTLKPTCIRYAIKLAKRRANGTLR